MSDLLTSDSVLGCVVLESAVDRWRAYLIVDGTTTSANCGHNHQREDLAERCVSKVLDRFGGVQRQMIGCAKLNPVAVGESEDLYEVTYRDGERTRWIRFFAPHVPSWRD